MGSYVTSFRSRIRNYALYVVVFRITPVPDSIIASAMSYGQMSSQMDSRIQSGLLTPMGSGITSTFSGMTSTYGSGFMSTLSGIKSGLLTPGWKTGIQSGSSSSADLDLRKIGQARNAIMDIKLNQVSFVQVAKFTKSSRTESNVFVFVIYLLYFIVWGVWEFWFCTWTLFRYLLWRMNITQIYYFCSLLNVETALIGL